MTLESLQQPNFNKPVQICGLTIYPPWDPSLHDPEENKQLFEGLERNIRCILWEKDHPVKTDPASVARLKAIRERKLAEKAAASAKGA